MRDLHYMNEKCTNKGGWLDSDMRKYLNNTIFNLLQEDLKSVIADRTIRQVKDGRELVSTDKLWLLSSTEIGYDYSTDENDVHFSLFSDERSRVKQVDGETQWYWLRSPLAIGSTCFCAITSGGSDNGSHASGAICVAFGFLIR